MWPDRMGALKYINEGNLIELQTISDLNSFVCAR